MTWDVLYMFPLFIVVIGILPFYFFFLRTYGRSKKAIIEGVAQLDDDLLGRLDWPAGSYMGPFDLAAPFQVGWKAWGQKNMQQTIVFQRFFLWGLPKTDGLSGDLTKAAFRFRLCLLTIITFCLLFFVPSFIGLSRKAAEFTGTPNGIWHAIFILSAASWIFLPAEKFKRWPIIKEIQ